MVEAWERAADLAAEIAAKRDFEERGVDAKNFVETLSVNVDNEKLSDEEFREFVRNTLPIVIILENL